MRTRRRDRLSGLRGPYRCTSLRLRGVALCEVWQVLLEADPPAQELGPAYNVGTGEGSSVRQIVEEILAAVGEQALGYDVAPRRGGDPAKIVGSVRGIERDFGWKPGRTLREMVESAWEAWNAPGAAQREAAQDAARSASAG